MCEDVPIANPIISTEKKKCIRCKIIKQTYDFHKNKKRKDGLAAYCKSCVSKEHQEIYIKNKDKILQLGKVWHSNNKEKHFALTKKWEKEHPERKKELRRKSAAKFRSTSDGAKKSKQWTKEWGLKNPEKKKANMKNWYNNNKEKSRRLRRKSELKRLYNLTVEDYQNMVTGQNNQCYICGKVPKNYTLCVDHNHETKKVRKLLCHGCNHAVGIIEKGKDYLNKLLNYLSEHQENNNGTE